MRETLVKSEEFKDSPVGRIPKDWDVKPLSELADVDRGKFTHRPRNDPRFYGGSYPFIQTGDIANSSGGILSTYSQTLNERGITVSREFPVGTIAITIAANIADTAILGIPMFFPDSVVGAVVKKPNSIRYVELCIRRAKQRLDARAPQSAQKNINLEDLRPLLIPVPSPEEQHKIAEVIDTIEEAIAHTSSLIAKLKQMKAGLLHDLLTRGLDENGELRDAISHPEQFKESPLGRIPKDWDVRLVGEVFDLQLGKMLSKASKIGHSPFPYLANRNVQWDEVDLSDLEWMDFNDNEREKFSLLPGDLLVCEGGESGRTAIWKDEMENCYFQKAIHRLRPKDSQVLPDYMLRFMRRAFEHGFLTSFTSQTSITHLTREKFALLPLPLPKVEEQKAIVNVLDSLDTRIRKEEAYREKLKLQKQGLMHDLLTGKVRVKNA